MCIYCDTNKPAEEWLGINPEVELISGGYVRIYIGPDKNGRIGIVGVGDGTTDIYYPNFCPECGDKLK